MNAPRSPRAHKHRHAHEPRRTNDRQRAHERQRIVAALLLALERRGPASLRESDVIAAGDVSARTFHRHFDDLDACFDFACEASLDVLLGPMVAAWSVPRPGPERLAAALAALLEAMAAESRLAELCLLHSPVRQPDRRTYRRAIDSLADLLLDLRRPPAPPDPSPPAASEEVLAHAALDMIAVRLSERRGQDLEDMAPRLAALLLPALELDWTDWPNGPIDVG